MVVIDEMNTITHSTCLDEDGKIRSKHAGAFHYIKKRYPYFDGEEVVDE